MTAVTAVTAVMGVPLTIVAAAAAVLPLALPVAECIRSEPPAGSFIVHVEGGLGPAAGGFQADTLAR